MNDMAHSDKRQNESDQQRGCGLLIVTIEGRNFVSLGIRPEVLRTMRYYCQIVIEDVKTSNILLNVRTNRVLRDNGQTNVVWNEELYFEFPPGKKKKDVELKVMCFEHSPLHDHFQGEVVLPLGHLHRNRVLDQWYALARRDKKPVRGEVHLKLELGVDVPENYVRRSGSLDGNDPTTVSAYRADMPPSSGMDTASGRADDKRSLAQSSPDKAFKKSIKGIRDKFKKTTKGVRGYFSEADYPNDGPQHFSSSSSSTAFASASASRLSHHHQQHQQLPATDDEGQLRAMRESIDLHDRHHFNNNNNNNNNKDGTNSANSSDGGGSFMDEEESLGEDGYHSDASSHVGNGRVGIDSQEEETQKKKKKKKKEKTKKGSRRKEDKSPKRGKKKRRDVGEEHRSPPVTINVITNSNHILRFDGLDDLLDINQDNDANASARMSDGSSLSSSLSSSYGGGGGEHMMMTSATDESGEVLGTITPAVLVEHLGDGNYDDDEDDEEDEEEGEISSDGGSEGERSDAASTRGLKGEAYNINNSSSSSSVDTYYERDLKADKLRSKGKERESLAVIREQEEEEEDEEANNSGGRSDRDDDDEDDDFRPSPFKRTIKRREGGGGGAGRNLLRVPADDSHVAAAGRLRAESLRLRPRARSEAIPRQVAAAVAGGPPPRLKLSADGAGYTSSGSKNNRRNKALYASSQRLALLNRFPTYDNKSKAAIISQRQRAYHIWLDAYHRDMDDFFDETRNWKGPIDMQDSDKVDYAALGKEWKRPWRKDMKRANETKDNLQEAINDEMEDLEDIIHKISHKASSRFEQPTLFSQSAVCAMRDLAQDERKSRRKTEKERKKATKRAAKLMAGDSAPSASASPSQQRRVGPLLPTPSVPPESTGYRPVVVLLATLVLLCILNHFM